MDDLNATELTSNVKCAAIVLETAGTAQKVEILLPPWLQDLISEGGHHMGTRRVYSNRAAWSVEDTSSPCVHDFES